MKNFNLFNHTNDELFKYLQNIQEQLPEERNAAIVIKISKNFLDVILNNKKKVLEVGTATGTLLKNITKYYVHRMGGCIDIGWN